MQTKTLIKLFLALIVLTAALLAQRYLLPKLTVKKSPYLKTVEKLKPDQVTQITLENPDSQLEITKDNISWVIDKYPAKTWQTDTLVRSLLEPTNPQLVANTSAKHQALGIDSDQATKITLQGSPRDIALLTSSSGPETYVRFDGEAQVYSLGSTPETSTDPERWYDLTITEITTTDVAQLTITHSQESFAFQKVDDQWSLANSNQQLDQDQVTNLLSNLSFFSAQSLETEITTEDLPSPQTTLTAAVTDQPSLTLQFIPQQTTEENPDYYVIKEGDPRIFVISNLTATPFLAPLSGYLQS
jgi:hypothetical protein